MGMLSFVPSVHNIVQRDLDCFDVLQNIILMYYIDNIMVIGQEEVASTLEAL